MVAEARDVSMFSTLWFDTVKLGYSIVHICECQVKKNKIKNVYFGLKIFFYLNKQCRP